MILTYYQCTLAEAKAIAARNRVKYITGTLHRYKYLSRESIKQLKENTPFRGLPAREGVGTNF
jgi:hypothetical protein